MGGEVLDRRAALEEAFDSAELDEQGVDHELPAVEAAEPTVSLAEATGDDSGKVETEAAAKTAKVGRNEPPKRTKGVPPEERVVADPAVAAEAGKPVSNLDKAPQSWGVTRDALWAKVSPDVRAVIAKREHEIQQGMSRAGNVQKVADEYVSTIRPFAQIISHMGVTPSQAVKEVMTTAAAMIVGSPDQKYAVLAEMVDRYGVDLAGFDAFLTKRYQGGKQTPQTQQIPPMQQLPPQMMQQLAPLMELQRRVVEADNQKQTQMRDSAAQEIQTASAKPYFEDIREDIADVMEISAKRGVVLTLDQAYAKAVQLNPEVSKLVQQRRVAPDASQAGRTLARQRKAASTVRGAPSSSALGAKPNDRRSAIEAAWNES